MNYRVLNTFDAHYKAIDERCLLRSSDTPKERKEKIDLVHQCRLPNAPMRASETLLAEQLRHPVAQAHFQVYSGADYRQIRRELKHAERREHLRTAEVRNQDPKRIPWLTGKLLGIEIEYYPRNREEMESLPPNPLTKVGRDGSIGSDGIEVRRISWQDEKGILAGLRSLPLRGHVTERCGLHVHVDVRHLPTPEVAYQNIVACYHLLRAMVPVERHNCTYCRWLNNGPITPTWADRYCAANWQSFGKHGTIEFRCQSGSVNTGVIEKWGLVCQWLTNFCAISDHTPKTLRDLAGFMPAKLGEWIQKWHAQLYPNGFKDRAAVTLERDDLLDDVDESGAWSAPVALAPGIVPPGPRPRPTRPTREPSLRLRSRRSNYVSTTDPYEDPAF